MSKNLYCGKVSPKRISEPRSKNPQESCRHDKGVEVHQGEVYCFHCGEHLGKAIRPNKLKQFIKNSATFEPIAQKIAKEEGLGELSKDEIEWLRYVVLKSLNKPERVSGEALSQRGSVEEEIRKQFAETKKMTTNKGLILLLTNLEDVVLGVVGKYFKPNPTTAKEWAMFFYQHLGYRIVEDEEQETALKKAMDEVVAKTEAYQKRLLETHEASRTKMLKAEAERNQNLMESIVRYLVKYSRHDMDPTVCKGCNQSHHYILCPYDLLVTMDDSGELLKRFEALLSAGRSQPPKTETSRKRKPSKRITKLMVRGYQESANEDLALVKEAEGLEP